MGMLMRWKVPCILMFLDDKIVEFPDQEISELKDILKSSSNTVVIVPDAARKSIASSLLMLKQEAVLNEEKLYNPITFERFSERMDSFWDFFFSNTLAQYQRPTIQAIVEDAINNTNNSGFLTIDPLPATIGQELMSQNGTALNSIEVEYEEFVKMRDKYTIIYENTPYWYKFVGQIIKLFSGRKRISLVVKDKGLKDQYKATAEDMAHWYYLQYEVLPKWYKRIGTRVVSKKN